MKDFSLLFNKVSVGIYLSVILICLSVTIVKCQVIPIKFYHLTVDNGLSHTDTKSIKQDGLGYIWVATLFGLNKYDGYGVKQYYNDVHPKDNASRNRLNDLYPDVDGKIWLATESGIQCFDSKNNLYLDVKSQSREQEQWKFTSITKLQNGNLLALSDHGASEFQIQNNVLINISLKSPAGISFSSFTTDKFKNVWLTSENSIWVLSGNEIKRKIVFSGTGALTSGLLRMFFDHNHKIFFISGSQILYVDEQFDQRFITSDRLLKLEHLHALETPGAEIRDIIQDQHNNYWVSTVNGLLFYSHSLKLTQIIHSKSIPNGLNTDHIEKLFIDRSQCLWICSSGGGINYMDLNAKLFYTIQHIPDQSNSLSGNHIRSLLDEHGKNLWIGTNEDGLNSYNYKTKLFTKYNAGTNPALKSNVVTCLALDQQNNLWIGTDNGIKILSKDRKTFICPPGYKNFPDYQIESLAADRYGQIWFSSTEKKMGVIRKSKDVYKVKYLNDALFVYPDPDKPEMYASSSHGLIHFFLNNDGVIVKKYVYQTNNDKTSLSSNYLYPVVKFSDSSLCVGTIGGGLDIITLKQGGKYAANIYGAEYQVFNDVESIQLDDHNNIWMGGRDLEKFNPITHSVMRFDKNDGLQGNSFKVGASCKGEDGKLYFGGINGLNYFIPDSIKINSIPAKAVLTDFVVNNNTLQFDQAHYRNLLTKSICYSDEVRLNYMQNNFLISFSGMHFANPLKCKYRYKLTGFDKDWKYTDGANPTASYSNLNYNQYEFVAEATNNDGIWSKSRAHLSIIIIPPWWKSGPAKLVYSLLIISLLAGAYIYQARWYTLKRTMAIQKVEKEKREEMHQEREDLYQQRLQFFTNILHEFRTPLALILGPLEKIIGETLDVGHGHAFDIMYRNAKRLTNLISELMNFSKVADGDVKLRVMPIELDVFTRQLHEEFTEFAASKKINLCFIKPATLEINPLDLQVIEKILSNLLNNAFKYTAEGGSVVLEMFFDKQQFKPAFNVTFNILNEFRAERYVYFRVADTGIGISKESISQVFDRYYRVSTQHLGSGVGLALVKSLTLLHKGDVYISSERFKGTEIVIALPWGENNYETFERESDIDGRQVIKIEKLEHIIVPGSSEIQPEPPSKKNVVSKQHVLIVEDNEELRSFLSDAIQYHYHVYEAEDGRHGLEMAIAHIPDLIISDVMMPKMSGMELCREIKQNFETSHIPFMILSAKDALEAKLEGLGLGADYYFSKPLSTRQLLLTIHNLFERKEKLKRRYLKDFYSEATELVHSTTDKAFLNRLINIIENNIEKTDLDVDFLSKEMYISRTKLYQKIQSITGCAVSEFIRTIRLKKAAYIMTHENISMNELIERIGMQSSSNFAKIFKKKFGMLPSQFLQSIKTDKS